MNDCAMVTVPCLITVAAGVLAPGHLGELTRYLPFELADDVLVSTKTMQRRVRALPSRVGVYFVLALVLFPGIGYLRVWDKMTAGLDDLGLDRPSEKALRDLRRRLGPAPQDPGLEDPRRGTGRGPGRRSLARSWWRLAPPLTSRKGAAQHTGPPLRPQGCSRTACGGQCRVVSAVR